MVEQMAGQMAWRTVVMTALRRVAQLAAHLAWRLAALKVES